MKIILNILAVIKIICGIAMVLGGLDWEPGKHLVLPGTLLTISGVFLLYLLFVRSEEE